VSDRAEPDWDRMADQRLYAYLDGQECDGGECDDDGTVCAKHGGPHPDRCECPDCADPDAGRDEPPDWADEPDSRHEWQV
jgi:hypothetical protein